MASSRPHQAEALPVELGFHRMRRHAVLPVGACPIHDERIERGMLAFGRAATELGLRSLQTLLLTVEPTGRGLLWRAQHRGRRPSADPELAARVAELLPDLVLLDDSMSLEFWGLAFRVRCDTFVQTNYRQMLVLYQAALDMLAAGPDDAVPTFSAYSSRNATSSSGRLTLTFMQAMLPAFPLRRLPMDVPTGSIRVPDR